MDRGLRAQLSPNEEATLQRIASAGVSQDTLRPPDVTQLMALQLIEVRDGAWHLTAIGLQRLVRASC